MPIIKQAELAELCKVSRASVNQSISRKKLAATPDGTLDTDHPLNAAYIKKRLSDLKTGNITGIAAKQTAEPRKKDQSTKPVAKKLATSQVPAKKAAPKKPAPPIETEADQKERIAFQAAVAKRQAKKQSAAEAKALAQSAPDSDFSDDDFEDVDFPDDNLGDDDELTCLQIRKLLADIRAKEAMTKRHDMATAIQKGEYVLRSLVQRRDQNLDSAFKTNLRDWPMRSAPKLEAMGRRGATVKDIREFLEKEMTTIIERIKHDTIEATKAGS